MYICQIINKIKNHLIMQTLNVFILMATALFGCFNGKISAGELSIILVLSNIALILITENDRREKRNKIRDEIQDNYRLKDKTPVKTFLYD